MIKVKLRAIISKVKIYRRYLRKAQREEIHKHKRIDDVDVVIILENLQMQNIYKQKVGNVVQKVAQRKEKKVRFVIIFVRL